MSTLGFSNSLNMHDSFSKLLVRHLPTCQKEDAGRWFPYVIGAPQLTQVMDDHDLANPG